MSENQELHREKKLAYYCQRFTELKTSKRLSPNAEYKPILILSVIDLIAQGFIENNQIAASEQLIDTFNKHWDILSSGTYQGKDNLHLPFFYLQSEGFWHIESKNNSLKRVPSSVKKLKEVVEYASLDPELFELLQDKNYRKELIDVLIATWFSGNQKDIKELLAINERFQKEDDEEEHSINLFNQQQKQPKSYLIKSVVRDGIFRKAVVHTYNYKCAFCGMKVTMSIKQNIVDGAHIKPFARFYDNRIDNGISFCKNHHWAFDKGLFTITDDYNIIVSNNFLEESPNSKPMKEFNSNQLWLPNEKESFPRIEALQWHRQNVFIS
ncbi:MAG: HNH endonuclease [Okeania sp. SIO2C9]|uniref:HNH endonuclease n=1 Tax=Okeania sp. SIO2C9 TaxID=2607791 RepID=UPI0013C183BC|nr:HNH endonuclease [Okeania sp. SIO2C9]NEQ76284.1 HNH endonuclease [Okeania sp. SIO2C9]